MRALAHPFDSFMKTILYPGPRAPESHAQMHLICFPHAGGNAHTYQVWARFLPASIGVWAYQAAGRGARAKEPAANRLSDLVDEIVLAIDRLLPKPMAFYGHSFGGFLAFQVMLRMRDSGRLLPELFVASASLPPPLVSANRSRWDGIASDQAMFDALVQMGGVSPELQPHAQAFLPMMPSVRAEYRFLTEYHHTKEDPLPVSLVLLSGLRDTLVPPESMEGWGRLFVGSPEIRTVQGGHFYVESCVEAVCAHLSELLARSPEAMA